jgi:hypothetical protein
LGFAALSAWPVIFAGKSFVSPNFGTRLLYERFPTLPGSRDSRVVEAHGSDIGAMAWQYVPYGAIGARAVFKDNTLPLWNRYASTGTPLLGQGQSMALDPMQWPVLAAGSAAWAWDLKFVVAKALFALGIGLVVYLSTGSLFAAVLLAGAAPFIGFFQYRINHSSYFSVCYAPWILVAALTARRCRARGGLLLALAGWFVADWAELNSGTVKEAACILAVLNFTGLALAASGPPSTSARRHRAIAVLLFFAAFAGITCPVWSSLMVSLRGSYLSSAAGCDQLPWGLSLGLFDEAFYRPFTPGDGVYGPALNFAFLGGVLYFFATFRTQWTEPIGRRLMVACGLVSAAVFRLLPAAWITAIPWFGRIGDFDSAMGCALLVLLAAVAGQGIATAAHRLPTRGGARDLTWAAAILLALVALYFRLAHLDPGEIGASFRFGPVSSGSSTSIDRPLIEYFAAILIGLPTVGLTARWSLLRPSRRIPGMIVGATVAGLFCWQGLPRMEGVPVRALSAFRVEFPARADFSVPSPAVQFVQSRVAVEPARVAGLGINLFPGWSGYYSLENISGPDALMSPDFRDLTAAMHLDRRMDWMLCIEPPIDQARLRDYDFFGIRYYLGGPRQGQPAGLEPLARLDLNVFQRPSAWPRAFFASGIESIDDVGDFVHRVETGSGAPFAAFDSETVRRNPELAPLANRRAEIVPAANYSLTNHDTRFSVSASAPGVAVLSEMDWPGYPHATLDGAVARTLRVNRTNLAIYISTPGIHHIEVDYRPPGFLVSVEASALFLCLSAAAVIWSLRWPWAAQEV